MRTREERLGCSVIRWQPNKEGTYSGVVISGGRSGKPFHDQDEARLLARLRNHAGTLEPSYFGMEAAIARFLDFMPGGFDGDEIRREREYKVRAHENLNAVLTQDQAADASDEQAAAVRAAAVWINLLSPYESMHLKSAFESPSGAAFLRGAAKFAAGQVDAGAEAMRRAMKGHGPLTWPTATYLPFLWDPDRQMFLKPEVTRDFAERVGDPFQYSYDSVISQGVYQSLLELTASTKTAIAALKPRDNIDVQSFIWVVGAYKESDKPHDTSNAAK